MSPPETKRHPATNPRVRPAAIGDVPTLHHLLEIYASKGNLLPRTMSELYRHLRDFFVVELDGKVVACGALEIFTEDLGEVRSLVVDEAHERRGLGRLLVERIVDEARTIGLKRLMALTYVPVFFHKLGFRTVAKDALPDKVWGVCVTCYKFNQCDETAVLKELN
ncbi:MAG TPA: N-acetyltransferase [Gammaproteobacteria bacterium]|nr:N-acetyltransferase [Gammaproteobacteria bacterium]